MLFPSHSGRIYLDNLSYCGSLFAKQTDFTTCSLKTDKGKLLVRAGRKAMGHHNGDCQVPEVFNTILRIFPVTNQISSLIPVKLKHASLFGLLPGGTE